MLHKLVYWVGQVKVLLSIYWVIGTLQPVPDTSLAYIPIWYRNRPHCLVVDTRRITELPPMSFRLVGATSSALLPLPLLDVNRVKASSCGSFVPYAVNMMTGDTTCILDADEA